MSKVADSIRRGLQEAIAYARGEAKKSDYRIHVPALIDVRAIRTKLGMTQEEFAGQFGFSVNTLRHWEQGKRQPEDKIKPSDYYWQELYWGPFSRSIILPVDVYADAAKSSMKNGLLTIRLPKMDRVKTKKIRIS